MIKVIANGAHGKMGQAVVNAVSQDPSLQLSASLDSQDNLAEAIQQKQAEVVVDFTHPAVVFENVKTILQSKAHAVVGTTGLSEAQLKDLGAIAEENKVSVIVCPNFAIGAVLMMKLSAEVASYMPNAEIIEMHHDKKADAPSGTAIKTAEMIYDNNPMINADLSDRKETMIIDEVRGGKKHNIPIHSVRLPGYVANQEVIFGGMGQTLRIRHDTISRESFMPGVVLSIKKAVQLTGLVYGLENIL